MLVEVLSVSRGRGASQARRSVDFFLLALPHEFHELTRIKVSESKRFHSFLIRAIRAIAGK